MTAAAAAAVPRRRRGPIDWGAPATYFVALVCVALSATPVLFVILNGFRSTAQMAYDPGGWPSPWILDNYIEVLQNEDFWIQLLNSAVAALGTTLGVVVLGVMAAFVIARYAFRGRDFLFSLFTAGLLFPLSVAVVPLYVMLKGMGLYGNVTALILPQIAFALPQTIIILVPFLRSIPAELEDAATIDGAGRFGFFWRVVLPLSGPGLVTVGVLAFVASWNAYLLPLLLMGDPTHGTLPLGVQAFSTAYSQDTAKVLAFTSIAMLPALLFFTIAQRRIVGGLTGAVKG